MAVAGLQNVSVYDSAFLREARSPASRLWGEPERPCTRASSVLQMWRELEGEHVVSHSRMRLEEMPKPLGSETSGSGHLSSQGSVNGNGSLRNDVLDDNEIVSYSPILVDSDNEHEDNNSFCSEQSMDLGETERDRVRQVFREWMSCGEKNHSPNVSHRNSRSRSPWLGHNECERVRIIREPLQTNSQQRGSHGSIRDESSAQIGSQIEQVHDCQLVSHFEVTERRPLRKLCGRQALLDMLAKAQRERKEEILKLLQQRPVSVFAHRNRIQTLLKGRFLLNQRIVRDERPACTAINELGLLRQRNVVSDLRDGFLSRLDRQPSQNEDLRNGQPQSSNELHDEGEIERHCEHVSSRTENVGVQNSQNNPIRDVSRHVQIAVETEAEVRVLENTNGEDETSGIGLALENTNGEEETSRIELIRGSHSTEDKTIESSCQESSPEEFSEHVSTTIEVVPTQLPYNVNRPQNIDASVLLSSTVGTIRTYSLEAHPIYNAINPQNVDASDDHEAVGHIYSMSEEIPLQGLSAHVEELPESESELEENDLHQSSGRENSEWSEINIEDSMLQETGSQWYQEPAIDDFMEQAQMQESDEEWPGNVLQEAISSWLDVPSGQETISAGMTNSFYFPDEENIQSTELRQLMSRRRVSTLLRSDFRESLDQLIQSYVQRQNDATAESDPDETSSYHASLEQEQEPEHRNQDLDQEARWSQQLQDEDEWPALSVHQHTQNEWEIINELRIDMARIRQRMNNMQDMLEACMNLQLELQRSVRQEVSAALNRSFDNSVGNAEITMDDSTWDHVRKGICCICCESHIDTLLYRCGHMCTCSKCGEELVQGGKCPMCYAPVIEVVRAYFIQ